jgi:hypothetical protein
MGSLGAVYMLDKIFKQFFDIMHPSENLDILNQINLSW